MPTLEAFIQSRAASDYGLASLVIQVLMMCAALVLLWRWPSFKAVVTMVIKPYADVVDVLSKIVRLRLPLILTIGLTARLPLLNESLWYDESFSLTVSRLPLEKLPAAIAGDVHPPLYYMLKWTWAHLTGDSAWMFRLPDLALGLVAICLMYRLARHIAGERVGLTAALLMALTPAAIYYSTEARAYSLLTVLVFGAMIALLEDRHSLYTLLIALLPATHNLGWFYALAFGLLALWRWRWHDYIVPFAFYLPLALPNMLLAAMQSGRMTDGYWLLFNAATPLWSLIFNLQNIDNTLIMVLIVPFVAITFLSLWTARGLIRQSPARPVAALALAVPLLVFLASLFWQPVFLHRALLPISLLLLIPLAYALHSTNALYYRPILTGLGILALVSFYNDASIVRPPYRAMLQQCGNAKVVYATSIQAAFLSKGNSDRKVRVWPRALDGGQTLRIEQMPEYGFDVSQYMPGETLCILWEESPRTSDAERVEIGRLLQISSYDYEYLLQPHPLQRIHVYVVSL
ncbi:MAG: glycosyltransferase family 39 protein [Chloroflexi bacterium]|nr:glycosyltransferase family 39 protein [Chloroflexota bacterium]